MERMLSADPFVGCRILEHELDRLISQRFIDDWLFCNVHPTVPDLSQKGDFPRLERLSIHLIKEYLTIIKVKEILLF